MDSTVHRVTLQCCVICEFEASQSEQNTEAKCLPSWTSILTTRL